MSLSRTLAAADLRNVARDPLLLVGFAAPLAAAAAVRAGLWATARGLPAVELGPYHGLMAAGLLLLAPYLQGMVAGFMLLDERDEGVLLAVAVAPISKARFAVQRLATSAVVAAAVGLAAALASGLPLPGLGLLVAAAVVAGLTAPLGALFLVALAANKVEGLALSKVVGLALLPVAGPYLLADPLSFLCAPLPTYWIGRALADGGAFVSFADLAAGLLVSLAWMAVLGRRFERRLG